VEKLLNGGQTPISKKLWRKRDLTKRHWFDWAHHKLPNDPVVLRSLISPLVLENRWHFVGKMLPIVWIVAFGFAYIEKKL